MHEAYQSRICQWIFNSNILVHLNLKFREAGLHIYTARSQQVIGATTTTTANPATTATVAATATPSATIANMDL